MTGSRGSSRGVGWAEMHTLAKANGRLRGLHEALAIVAESRAAYSEDVFPWPSSQDPPTIDAVSARMGRLLCDQLTKRLRAAIDVDEAAPASAEESS